MALTPLHDRVLVERVEGDEKTAGGLIIPESAKEKPAEGIIVAVGEGARKDSGELIPMAVKKGDKILFGKWSGTEVTVDGKELLMMKESDVLGILS
ncbi:chaperonin GroES [Litoreibacter halocynthiae]|uniref:Co-chaperonin GroES n=2 Tax=Litoreibacter TaxID=947567 RepID=A0A4V3EWT6_9RHOB|nr:MULTISPECIES: co-chaperone GroES [Litoreibacter]TDT75275.1 chaperonin GroES [Litoreibacter halocynthiae]SHE99666.1 chaperonin GroES [Litoreibacter ascidiaceicola]